MSFNEVIFLKMISEQECYQWICLLPENPMGTLSLTTASCDTTNALYKYIIEGVPLLNSL